ncbi:MAG: acetoacetate--CoA ligase [Candidatus Melainabacteria bacterium]|nr:acetoacetate--CoA ligase [Candidatus Melainabacteria bacterium]
MTPTVSSSSQPLWTPPTDALQRTQMGQFCQASGFSTYDALYHWSIEQPADFWQSWLKASGLVYQGSTAPAILSEETLDATLGPGQRFFPNVTLNLAENLLQDTGDRLAIIGIAEGRATLRLSHDALYEAVRRCAASLRQTGVKPGDRVGGILPNVPEAVIAMLATASLGAVWSSASPDFGTQALLDRFGQIEPVVLFVATGYQYHGKVYSCIEKHRALTAHLPTLRQVVWVSILSPEALPSIPEAGIVEISEPEVCFTNLPPSTSWDQWQQIGEEDAPLTFQPMGFNDPAYILYSSGTTGLPKAIVHGVGGTLLQHAKELKLHCDLKPGDNLLYFTTCGWMMWNWMVSALMTGATITLLDGSPSYPTLDRLWEIAATEGVTHLGTSPKFLGACRKATQPPIEPGKRFRLRHLRMLLSTGAPLLPEDFDWVYGQVKPDLALCSISGGTDIISCFMLGNPLLPVYRGELQGAGLGLSLQVLQENGQTAATGEPGELVCQAPFPCMPLYFWNDPDYRRYRSAYFPHGSQRWFHGDQVIFTGSQGACGGFVIAGRSDTTLNPGGVRIGTAEIYRLVETLPEIADSLVVSQPWQDDVRIVLFVKPNDLTSWDDILAEKIRQRIRQEASPRHVPAVIQPVQKIPYTPSGKKLEMAVKHLLCGEKPQNLGVLSDPDALQEYEQFAQMQAQPNPVPAHAPGLPKIAE